MTISFVVCQQYEYYPSFVFFIIEVLIKPNYANCKIHAFIRYNIIIFQQIYPPYKNITHNP